MGPAHRGGVGVEAAGSSGSAGSGLRGCAGTRAVAAEPARVRGRSRPGLGAGIRKLSVLSPMLSSARHSGSAWLLAPPEFPIPSSPPPPISPILGFQLPPQGLRPPPRSLSPSTHSIDLSLPLEPSCQESLPSDTHGPLPPAPIAPGHSLPRDHLPRLTSRVVSALHPFLSLPGSRTVPLPSVAPTLASPGLLPAPISRCCLRQRRVLAPLHLRPPSPPPPAPWRAVSRTSCSAPSV